MSGRNQIQDTRPLASRAVSNRELTKLGFRRRTITKEESGTCAAVASNMMYDSEIQILFSDFYDHE